MIILTPDEYQSAAEALHDDHENKKSLLLNIAGLKAMLDILPEDTECYPADTIDSYLWVIESLLENIYQQLSKHMEDV